MSEPGCCGICAGVCRLRAAEHGTPMPEPSTPDCEHGYRAAGGIYDCPVCDDHAGAECSRLEADMLLIHDALVDSGWPGAVNADSIIERIGLQVSERDRYRDELHEAHTWLLAAEMCDCEYFEGAGTKLCRFAEVLDA